ncbi:MAG: Replicative DNA helicase (DnaB) [Candidatus Ozemobacter sibiricus]|uniref:Replicative DNA helicase (DnaB) n=1 Tax=Candidatus Ozemobacter sibiricus TaxID=2268124 RepID=A0A367ZJC1_9BACT|nr:MAG: Replicative DNA helicase (DnaB) [Candidatus Ozemobacter sibiricus]
MASLPDALAASALARQMAEIALDEELILANLAFDPVVAGRQLREKRFSVADFQGVEANRVLLGTMLEMLEGEESLTLANVIDHLREQKKGTRSKLEWVGLERVEQLFTNPFLAPGVRMLEDLEPVIDRIRDRNIRNRARRLLITYSEKIAQASADALEAVGNCIQELRTLFLENTAGYLRDLTSHLYEMRELVHNGRARKLGYSGFDTNFPLLQERLNGIQKEFYLITGGVGMGKSTFCTQLAWDLVNLNPSLTVLFFSLDMNRLDVTAKIVAQAQEIPIDYVKNPFMPNAEFEKKRLEGLELVERRQERLMIVDESGGRIFLDDIKKLVKRVRLERGGDLAVIIDPLFKIHLRDERISFFEKCNQLSSELKSLCAAERVTLIATAGLPKAISHRRPRREDLQEIMGLLYDPYVIFFLYCDYLNDFETPFLEWEWGKDNFMIPISELHLAKNKMGVANTRIFYRYFEAYAKYKECAPQEVENYTAMIENLQKFKEDKALKENAAQAHQRREDEF